MLDILKGVSGRKSRNAVLEELIPIIYAIIRIRATEPGQGKAMDTIWELVEELLEPYWKPYKQTMIHA
jgi:hypothetical protein